MTDASRARPQAPQTSPLEATGAGGLQSTDDDPLAGARCLATTFLMLALEVALLLGGAVLWATWLGLIVWPLR